MVGTGGKEKGRRDRHYHAIMYVHCSEYLSGQAKAPAMPGRGGLTPPKPGFTVCCHFFKMVPKTVSLEIFFVQKYQS